MLVWLKGSLKVWRSPAWIGTLVLPTITAPAARRRATATASTAGTWSTRSGVPYAVRRPSVSNTSLMVITRPWRGPSDRPNACVVGGGRSRGRTLEVEGDHRVERRVHGLDAGGDVIEDSRLDSDPLASAATSSVAEAKLRSMSESEHTRL